jgi:cyanophycin synthetase
MRELGAVAAAHFDAVIVREDEALRGRERGETAAMVARGVRDAVADGARCRSVEIVLDEIESVREAMSWANAGDVVVICADKHARVLAELEGMSKQAQAGAHGADRVADPDYSVSD